MIEYSYDPPYNLWSGNRSDTLNKWKINYKGSIATASTLPEKGDFKGDTYNVLEDGSNYMWNGKSWDKLDANVYVGATSTKDGIQGLVPPAEDSERNKFLKGDATWDDVAWSMIVGKPLTFTPSAHTHDWDDILNEPAFALDNGVVHTTGDESIDGQKEFQADTYLIHPSLEKGTVPSGTNIWRTLGFADNASSGATIDSLIATVQGGLLADGAAGLQLMAFKNAVNSSSFLSLRFLYLTNDKGSFAPTANNTISFGTSNYKWSEIWCSQSSINSSSDERLKQSVSSIPDEVLDAWDGINWIQFKYNDAVNEKGQSNARLHNGLIAQEVDRQFKSKNLDISKYGLFLHDEWDAEPEEKDKEGNVIQKARSAGDEYGLRYTEALCMEAAYQRRRAERAEARIKALEDRLEALEAKLA